MFSVFVNILHFICVFIHYVMFSIHLRLFDMCLSIVCDDGGMALPIPTMHPMCPCPKSGHATHWNGAQIACPFPSCCMIMHDAICIGLHLSAFRECCMCRLLRIHYVVYRNGFDYQVRLLSFRQKRRWQVALNWSQNKTCHNQLSHLLILKGAPLRFSKHDCQLKKSSLTIS